MPINSFVVVVLFLFCVSCDCTYQYDVYVENATDHPIKIEYKSDVIRDGVPEGSLVIPAGSQQRIISTKDIATEDGCRGTKASHCKYVAEYVRAYTPDNHAANLEWCDQTIKFEKTDIQQAEFTIRYTKENFLGKN